MIGILGVSGSLRAGSYNTALLRAAQVLAGPTIEFEVATLHGIPLYDGDLEQREGLPMAVRALKDKVVASDGVLLATPEYNNGIPGAFKNAIDWLSRPPDDSSRVFGDRPFALIGATPPLKRATELPGVPAYRNGPVAVRTVTLSRQGCARRSSRNARRRGVRSRRIDALRVPVRTFTCTR